MVEGFVGEEGEGVGFFGGFGDLEMGGGDDFDGIFQEVASGPPEAGVAREKSSESEERFARAFGVGT